MSYDARVDLMPALTRNDSNLSRTQLLSKPSGKVMCILNSVCKHDFCTEIAQRSITHVLNQHFWGRERKMRKVEDVELACAKGLLDGLHATRRRR